MLRTINSISSSPLPPRTTGHHPILKTSKLLTDYPVASTSPNSVILGIQFDRLVAGIASTEAPLALSATFVPPPQLSLSPTGSSQLSSSGTTTIRQQRWDAQKRTRTSAAWLRGSWVLGG